MKKNQRGFTAAVVIILIFVVGLLSVLAYNVTKNAQNEPMPAAVESQKPAETNGVTKQQEDAAVATVKKLYDGYHVILSDMTNSRMSELEPLRQATIGNPSIYPSDSPDAESDQPTGADPVICAQDGFSSVTYGKPVVKDGKVVVPVVERFEGEDNVTVYATVDVSKNKIVAIQCPESDY